MRLGSLHKYWLAETDKKGMRGLMVGDYSGTSHAVAVEGLIRLGLVKVKKVLTGGNIIIEITSSGKRCLNEERKVKRRHM